MYLPAWTDTASPAHDIEPFVDKIHHIDALDLLARLPDASVDMVLCDLPYGVTACAWDAVIPIEPMWEELKRIVKPRAAIVLTGTQPFTSRLVSSNYEMFRYEWVWVKSQGTGYLNANRQPMKTHESILVFAKGTHTYNPQMRRGEPYRATRGAAGGFIRDKTVGGYLTLNHGNRYPLSVIDFNSETGLHPTQKPVALFEYLIKTYTQPGEIVVDMTVGSGTTAEAAKKTGRRYICGDITREYVEIARRRVRDTDPYQATEFENGVKQLSLFEKLAR